MEKMTETEFINEVEKLGIKLNQGQIEQFRIYLNYLIEYNQHCNLTAIKDPDEVYLKHFYDSLMILKYRKFDNKNVLDIGSGAGFPGVPLKVVCPNINLTCLDSNGKKTQFLLMLRKKLNLNYDIVNARAEEYIVKKREFYDYVISRAVSNVAVICELSIPYLKIGGEAIAYRGANDEDFGEYACKIMGAKIKDIYFDILPYENAKRTFICIYKERKTDLIYPRRYDKILKKPLQNLEK